MHTRSLPGTATASRVRCSGAFGRRRRRGLSPLSSVARPPPSLSPQRSEPGQGPDPRALTRAGGARAGQTSAQCRGCHPSDCHRAKDSPAAAEHSSSAARPLGTIHPGTAARGRVRCSAWFGAMIATPGSGRHPTVGRSTPPNPLRPAGVNPGKPTRPLAQLLRSASDTWGEHPRPPNRPRSSGSRTPGASTRPGKTAPTGRSRPPHRFGVVGCSD